MGLFSFLENSRHIKSLRKDFRGDIERYQEEVPISDNLETEFQKLQKLANYVFDAGFSVKYRFTYEDLFLEIKEKELPKEIEDNAKLVCDFLSDMEFDMTKISRPKLLEASDALHNLTIELDGLTAKDPKGVFKLFGKKEKPPKKIVVGLTIKDPLLPAFTVQPDTDDTLYTEAFPIQENIEDIKKEDIVSKEIESDPVVVQDEPDADAIYKKAETKIIVPELSVQENKTEKKDKKETAIKKKTKQEKPQIQDLPSFEDIQTTEKETKIDKTAIDKNVNLTKIIEPETPSVQETQIAKKEPETIIKKKTKQLKNNKHELPSFEEIQTDKKETEIKNNLSDIVKKLEAQKGDIKQGISILSKEKEVLQKQKDQLKKFDLPRFKAFDDNLSGQIKEIDAKTKKFESTEENVDKKLLAMSEIEKGLKKLSSKLQKDDESIKNRGKFLDAKEKVINDIKKEMDSKYTTAITEIENLKQELAIKEKSFLELQKFYQQRENRLSVEEGNLLDEKRSHGKLVSSLLTKHIEAAQNDLKSTEEKISDVKDRIKKADFGIKETFRKFADISREKENLQKDVKEKQKYFAEIEKGFLEKDPEFDETNKLLDSKIENNIERESAIKSFEKNLDASIEEFKGKTDYFDLKELDIKALGNEIDRIQLNLAARETRVKYLERHVNRRIDSYKSIKKKVSYAITNEKRLLSLVQARLTKKGYVISGKLNTLEKNEKIYDEYNRKLKSFGFETQSDPLEDINIESDTGNPSILDILKLLNIARDYLEHHEKDRAKDAYLEIQRVFDDLNEDEREELYPEVTKVFKTRDFTHTSHHDDALTNAEDYTNVNIDELLTRFETFVNNSDYQMSEHIYSKLQERYTELSANDKNRYYPRIIELYNKVLEHQVR